MADWAHNPCTPAPAGLLCAAAAVCTGSARENEAESTGSDEDWIAGSDGPSLTADASLALQASGALSAALKFGPPILSKIVPT